MDLKDLGSAGGAEESTFDDSPAEEVDVEGEEAARMLLDKLLEAEKIELVKGASLDDLPPGLGAILTARGSPYKKAEAVTDWLLEQEDVVDDVYYADEELAKVLEVW